MNIENENNNVFDLMKQALLFYSNEMNYNSNNPINQSLIELDNGEQARFVLNQIKELNDYNDNLNIDYEKYIEEIKIKYKDED
jgi:hypothetical protein